MDYPGRTIVHPVSVSALMTALSSTTERTWWADMGETGWCDDIWQVSYNKKHSQKRRFLQLSATLTVASRFVSCWGSMPFSSPADQVPLRFWHAVLEFFFQEHLLGVNIVNYPSIFPLGVSAIFILLWETPFHILANKAASLYSQLTCG